MSSPLSVGDILALTSLVYTIVNELRDGTNSKSAFRCLITDLEALLSALELVQSTFTPQPQQNEKIVCAILVQASHCRATILISLDRYKSYKKAFASRGPRCFLRQIIWKVFKSDEIADLRARLTDHRTMINMLFAALNYVKDDNPRSIGYTLENGVKLIDALGKTVILPMEMCSTKSQFDAALRAMFMNRAGQRYVERGDFEISCQEGKVMIDAHSWERIVKVGITLEMSVVVRGLIYEDPRNDCPRCGSQNSSVTKNEGWIDCRYCDGRFQLSLGGNRQEIMNRGQISHDHNVQLFRNIHLIMLHILEDNLNLEWPLELAFCGHVQRPS